jgi:hypothetical protein
VRAPRFPLGPLLVLASITVFVAGMGVAMTAYPGGTWCARDAIGHDFAHNFFCDLLHDVALGGRPNATAAMASRIAMLALLVGLVVAFWLVPRSFEHRPRLGFTVRSAGGVAALGGVGVALSPSNHYPKLHALCVLAAAVPGLLALLVATFALFLTASGAPGADSSAPPDVAPHASPNVAPSVAPSVAPRVTKGQRAAAWIGACAVLVGGIDAWLYARQLDGSHACDVTLPALERVVAALVLAWMAVVAVRAARRS